MKKGSEVKEGGGGGGSLIHTVASEVGTSGEEHQSKHYVHSSHASSTRYSPLPQLTHVLPSDARKEPDMHMQAVEDVLPRSSVVLAAGQPWHVFAPPATEYVPIGHSSHDSCPCVFLWEPGGQSVHVVARGVERCSP